MRNRDASMFEQVANHGLLTAETENYATFHSDGETSIICSVVIVTLSSMYNIFPFFLEGLFLLLWYGIITSVGWFCGSVHKLQLKCHLRNCFVQLFPGAAMSYTQTELSTYIKPVKYNGAWLKLWGKAMSAHVIKGTSAEVFYLLCGKPALQLYKESEHKTLLFHKAVIYGLSHIYEFLIQESWCQYNTGYSRVAT